MTQVGQDTLKTRSTLTVKGKEYAYYSLAKAAETIGDVSKLPFSLKVLLENMLRFEDGGFTVSTGDAQAIADWQKDPTTGKRKCKVSLQRALKLDNGPRTPLICVVGQFDSDGGFDIVSEAITPLLERIFPLNTSLTSGKGIFC